MTYDSWFVAYDLWAACRRPKVVVAARHSLLEGAYAAWMGSQPAVGFVELAPLLKARAR